MKTTFKLSLPLNLYLLTRLKKKKKMSKVLNLHTFFRLKSKTFISLFLKRCSNSSKIAHLLQTNTNRLYILLYSSILLSMFSFFSNFDIRTDRNLSCIRKYTALNLNALNHTCLATYNRSYLVLTKTLIGKFLSYFPALFVELLPAYLNSDIVVSRFNQTINLLRAWFIFTFSSAFFICFVNYLKYPKSMFLLSFISTTCFKQFQQVCWLRNLLCDFKLFYSHSFNLVNARVQTSVRFLNASFSYRLLFFIKNYGWVDLAIITLQRQHQLFQLFIKLFVRFVKTNFLFLRSNWALLHLRFLPCLCFYTFWLQCGSYIILELVYGLHLSGYFSVMPLFSISLTAFKASFLKYLTFFFLTSSGNYQSVLSYFTSINFFNYINSGFKLVFVALVLRKLLTFPLLINNASFLDYNNSQSFKSSASFFSFFAYNFTNYNFFTLFKKGKKVRTVDLVFSPKRNNSFFTIHNNDLQKELLFYGSSGLFLPRESDVNEFLKNSTFNYKITHVSKISDALKRSANLLKKLVHNLMSQFLQQNTKSTSGVYAYLEYSILTKTRALSVRVSKKLKFNFYSNNTLNYQLFEFSTNNHFGLTFWTRKYFYVYAYAFIYKFFNLCLNTLMSSVAVGLKLGSFDFRRIFTRVFSSLDFLLKLKKRLLLLNLVCSKNLPYNKGIKTKFRFRRKKVKSIKFY